jgi:DNA-binding transcriptional regulator YbjK
MAGERLRRNMTRDDFRIELHALFKKFASQNNISDSECNTMAVTVSNLLTSDMSTRQRFYKLMSDFARERAEECKQSSDMILAGLDMTDEEKEALIKSIKEQIDEEKNSKIEN